MTIAWTIKPTKAKYLVKDINIFFHVIIERIIATAAPSVNKTTMTFIGDPPK
ncbi:hypothetical protein [Clostridium sp. HBUAS56010]|uniref:hypothetical protein n=1 Tax=Clostridium sp. HBUAS56010 TaxID=2571127 RepID=UPI00163D5103|nr:hypothetical protein [Clostridium sp. HBUAS56010]